MVLLAPNAVESYDCGMLISVIFAGLLALQPVETDRGAEEAMPVAWDAARTAAAASAGRNEAALNARDESATRLYVETAGDLIAVCASLRMLAEAAAPLMGAGSEWQQTTLLAAQADLKRSCR